MEPEKKKRGAPFGARNGSAKLTTRERRAIRASKMSAMKLAILFNVDKSTIQRVRDQAK